MLGGNTKNFFDTKLTCIFYTNHFRIFCMKRYKFVVNLQGIKTLKITVYLFVLYILRILHKSLSSNVL